MVEGSLIHSLFTGYREEEELNHNKDVTFKL